MSTTVRRLSVAHIARKATIRVRQPTYERYVHGPMRAGPDSPSLGGMPPAQLTGTQPRAALRRVLPVDVVTAVAVGLLAFGSTRWNRWWDEAGPHAGPPMRHGGPPFRTLDTEVISTAWSLPWLVTLGVVV